MCFFSLFFPFCSVLPLKIDVFMDEVHEPALCTATLQSFVCQSICCIDTTKIADVHQSTSDKDPDIVSTVLWSTGNLWLQSHART